MAGSIRCPTHQQWFWTPNALRGGPACVLFRRLAGLDPPPCHSVRRSGPAHGVGHESDRGGRNGGSATGDLERRASHCHGPHSHQPPASGHKPGFGYRVPGHPHNERSDRHGFVGFVGHKQHGDHPLDLVTRPADAGFRHQQRGSVRHLPARRSVVQQSPTLGLAILLRDTDQDGLPDE